MPSITDVKGITVGSAEDLEALTGCTVILTGPEGAVCGVDVRGGGPGTRETDALSPLNMVEKVHAVVLAGGSAFGLDAACGVMDYLEEKGIGHKTTAGVVPIVPAAVLYDLGIGNPKVRPNREMGYRACMQAGKEVKEGNYGAGAGATVGKLRGYNHATKGGLGTFSLTLSNGFTVGAIVAVNAFGDVWDPQKGKIVAGVRDDQGRIIGTRRAFQDMSGLVALGEEAFYTNTTLAVVACNGRFNKSQLTKLAGMSHNGLVRVINPVHTYCDGDTVFALATGEMEADLNIAGYLAQEVLARAVLRAVYAAETAGGIKCWRD
ncbi:L-aminopeptidase/D-esterase [Thermosyntropha lipolytica DSM 11003]|uniref:L-aminopeptidase/D-esterase n=1 Tax=Thermosyntropha lipolytica DSM 11003 TaxID=1123382 RepID=A0A1M5JVD7_9FIRM|nr:P1 family peptidase [Thermosyntropha lipolytica]SHG44501.1 L-aminopeptidase/D-esterase [Thermosyntropha lipolytica DSM 11003]